MFRDRVDAGRQLAATLARRLLGEPAPLDREQRPVVVTDERAVVLGLPRGGVPVAAEVARTLDGDLDVLVVRKIGVPWQPELAVGAVGEGGVRIVNTGIAEAAGLDDARLDALARQATEEAERRAARWRSGPPIDLTGRTVIIVDDGIATGATVRAAVAVVRARGGAQIVVATPVAAAEAVAELRRMVDDLVVLLAPDLLVGVGRWYLDFGQTTDDEVAALLAGPR